MSNFYPFRSGSPVATSCGVHLKDLDRFSTVLSTTCTCVTSKTCSSGAVHSLPWALRILHELCLLDLVRGCSPGCSDLRDLHVLLHELHHKSNTSGRLPRSSRSWKTVLPDYGGRQLRESFTELSQVRSDSNLTTVSRCRCSTSYPPWWRKRQAPTLCLARRPIPGQNTSGNGFRHHRKEENTQNLGPPKPQKTNLSHENKLS